MCELENSKSVHIKNIFINPFFTGFVMILDTAVFEGHTTRKITRLPNRFAD